MFGNSLRFVLRCMIRDSEGFRTAECKLQFLHQA